MAVDLKALYLLGPLASILGYLIFHYAPSFIDYRFRIIQRPLAEQLGERYLRLTRQAQTAQKIAVRAVGLITILYGFLLFLTATGLINLFDYLR